MNTSKLGAVIQGENHTAEGEVDGISLDGVYIRLRNPCFLVGELVRIELYIEDLNEPSCLLKLQSRVARVDEQGMRLYFRPMEISHRKTLEAIVKCADQGNGRDALAKLRLSLCG